MKNKVQLWKSIAVVNVSMPLCANLKEIFHFNNLTLGTELLADRLNGSVWRLSVMKLRFDAQKDIFHSREAELLLQTPARDPNAQNIIHMHFSSQSRNAVSWEVFISLFQEIMQVVVHRNSHKSSTRHPTEWLIFLPFIDPHCHLHGLFTSHMLYCLLN